MRQKRIFMALLFIGLAGCGPHDSPDAGDSGRGWDAFTARRRQDAHKKHVGDTPTALEIDVDERYASWVPSRKD